MLQTPPDSLIVGIVTFHLCYFESTSLCNPAVGISIQLLVPHPWQTGVAMQVLALHNIKVQVSGHRGEWHLEFK